MSEAPEKDSRTEEATEKRLNDALEDGNAPFSREVASLAYLVAAMTAISLAAQPGGQHLAAALANLLANSSAIELRSGGDAEVLMSEILRTAALSTLPFVLFFTVAGIVATLIQSQRLLVWKRVAPDFKRVSPLGGLKKMTGFSGLSEFLKTSARLALFACGLAFALLNHWKVALSAMMTDPWGITLIILGSLHSIILPLVCISLIFVVFDLPVVRIFWQRSLRMSLNEVKDEQKQSEGDPIIKARRRSIAKSRVRRRLKREVSKATVIIANPTHFAVALRYVREEGGAPRVVAKGADLIALTIRRVAEEKGIPVVEDKALARSLYKKVEVDQMIPVEFYRVIAEILIRFQTGRKHSGVMDPRSQH